MLTPAYICDAIRTPFCPYGGALSSMRADDLAAIPLTALMVRNPAVDWEQLADVVYSCTNQAGEANCNVARIASLLAGLPAGVPAVTLNRLCGSGLEAIGSAARAIKSGEVALMIAGGVESMSRAPYVLGKAETPYARDLHLTDTTQDGHCTNKSLTAQYGIASMAETAENVAAEFGIERHAQDRLAWASHRKASAAEESGYFAAEITPATLTHLHSQDDPVIVTEDEWSPARSMDVLSRLPGQVFPGGSVTSGNAAHIGDGACALLLANDKAAHRNQLVPKALVLGMAAVGVPPPMTGIGSAAAARKLLVQTGLALEQMDVIEINEAYAAQVVAALRDWGVQDDDPRVNPNGGAIALGHPLAASGARLVAAAMLELQRIKGRYALCAMCVGFGQGIALIIERV